MIPQAGGPDTVIQPTGDVTSWDTYFAPDDDIHGILLAELSAAVVLSNSQQPPEVHSSQFGFTDQDIADAFAALAINRASRFLFDKTQEAGHYEEPIVKAMVAKMEYQQWAIGTSKKAGQILHTKAVVLLYPDGTGWTMTGSFNLSASAENQFNIVDVVRSRSRAELFANRIDAMFDWVKTNQGDNQP
jgi:hypothetical protein